MGSFSFLVLLFGFLIVIYWYFLSEHNNDNAGSNGYLGLKTGIEDGKEKVSKSLFSQKFGISLRQKAKSENRDKSNNTGQNKTDPDDSPSDQHHRRTDGPATTDLRRKEQQQNQKGEEPVSKDPTRKFYRYIDDTPEKKYKSTIKKNENSTSAR